ncbi:hypothetical protein N7541_010480, partial [Penicillium brevicompactum]
MTPALLPSTLLLESIDDIQTLMNQEARELSFADVTFLEKVQESKYSVVFKVLVHGTTCVMKVYHDRASSEHDSPDQEVNLFICESTAYRRLKAKGLCDRGVIPDFYGTITNIQPTLKCLFPMNLDNFSSQYLRELAHILEDIHLAGVLHGDPKPRNMMISRDRGKALWIDFDSAQTFSESLTTRQRAWIEEENEVVDYFVEAL